LASIGAIAEFPHLVEEMFVSGNNITDNGIYNLKFFIRGKPWIVSVDDYMTVNTFSSKLVFTQPDPYTGAMWSTIVEKAWAKIAANYENANGGYLETGLRTVSGAPVFSY